ncbi:MAG: DivIVA domain-containing protein [bacterium]
MKFTALNIKNQQFNKSLKGYNKEEVEAFLERLAEEFEILQSENDIYKRELDSIKEQNKEFRKIEKHLQNTLVNAQESSSKVVETAKKQTALIVREAELKANQTIEKAKEEANYIRDSVIKLREEKNLLLAKLKAMVETQANLLEAATDKPVTVNQNKIKAAVTENKSEINIDKILERLL